MDKVNYDIKRGVWSNEYGSFDLEVSLSDNDWIVDMYIEHDFIDEVLIFIKYKDYPLNQSQSEEKAKFVAGKEYDKFKYTIHEYMARIEELTIKYLLGTVGEEVAFQNIMN